MSPTNGDTDDPPEREQIREILAGNIRHLDGRVADAWADDLTAADERLQLTRLRTLSQLARQYRLLARDADVDEMEEQVTLLQEAIEHGGER